MNRATRLGFAGGLAIAVLGALALRLFFIRTPHGALDSDEAIVGLMGRHVLRGEFPIFYYGQKYMGGLEPQLAALGFAIGGATPLVLKLVCLAVALVLVWLTAELGRRILGPGPGLVAGVFMAIPPIFLTVWSVKARGGFIETLVLGSLVLLLAHRTVEMAGRRRLRAALVLGLVGGLGWWTCQLVGSYLAAAGVLVVRGAGWAAGLRVLPAVAGAFVLGSLPMWLDGWLRRPVASPTWVVADPATAARQLGDVFWIGLPALLGPGGRWPASWAVEVLTVPVLSVYALAWLVLVWTRVRAWRGGPEPSPGTGAALDAIVALPVIAALACALSGFGWFVAEPRYLLPLAAVVPILVAALLATIWRAGWPRAAAALGMALLAVNVAGHLLAPWTAARVAPYSLEPALAFFESRRIPVVATTYWIGPRLTFESGERVVAVPMHDGPDRYPPYSAVARRTDRLAYAFLPGTADVGAVEQKLRTLGVAHERSSVGELLILHDLRLPGLDAAPPGPPLRGPRAPAAPGRTRPNRHRVRSRRADRPRDFPPRGRGRGRISGRLGGSRPAAVALSGHRPAGEGRRAGRAARRGLHAGSTARGELRRGRQAARLHAQPPDGARRRPPRAHLLLVDQPAAGRRSLPHGPAERQPAEAATKLGTTDGRLQGHVMGARRGGTRRV